MDNRTKYEHPNFFLFLNLYFFFGDCETRVFISIFVSLNSADHHVVLPNVEKRMH